ncbi:ATP-binding protein [Geomonas limicola]|nr:ATP-binding protein [Geomonas limicola]
MVPSLVIIVASFSLVHCVSRCFPTLTSHWLTFHPITRTGALSLITLAGLGWAIASIGIALVFKRRLLRPLNGMIASVRSGEHLAPTGLKEFDILGSAVNDSLTRERLSQERLQTCLGNAPVILYAMDRFGVFTLSEGKGLAALGLAPGQVVGKSALEVYRDYPLIVAGVERALAGETFCTENAVGSKVFETWYSPLKDERGAFAGSIGVAVDVSERKAAEAERELLGEQLLQSQKMESVGRLAGGVAHDFNNLLTPIIGYAELLQLDRPGERAHERLDQILKAASRAKDLVQQLLSFSRKQVLEFKTIDLNRVVGDFTGILGQTIRESVDLRVQLCDTPCPLHGDQHQLEQVIMNLAVNAQDAIEGHGIIAIETRHVELDEKFAELNHGIVPGPHLALVFSDSGCGMDRETQAHIFEPFFTTKGLGKGTGLGLATVFGIVRQHGGIVTVQSQPERGSTFTCYFPEAGSLPVQERLASLEQALPEVKRRCILLVEDNTMVRTLVQELLTRRGFQVLVADEPTQALWLSKGVSLDLLVTDVIMPNMTGPELHAALKKSHPALKVLYMSGYTREAIPHPDGLEDDFPLIQKPFAISNFARRVEALLN